MRVACTPGGRLSVHRGPIEEGATKPSSILLEMHRTTPQFWKRFGALPKEVQQLARKNFELLKQDSQHPSLQLKQLGEYWSARVGLGYRALAVKVGADYVWVWIGTHGEYDKLIK